MSELNFFDTYTLMAIQEENVPKASFFKDRYFSERTVFKSDKVLTEYRKGDRKMAAFVSERIGDIPMERRGYEIHEYQPAFIAPSRLLTTDDLKKRGFGEALYPGMTKAQRAARLIQDDLREMDIRISRREEWMAVNTMLYNACPMQEYVDAKTQGEALSVKFYDGASEHTYTVAVKWDAAGNNFMGDVRAMCRLLSRRGLHAVDLLLGADVADAVFENAQVRELLDKQLAYNIGAIDQTLTAYDGVVNVGSLNFGGYRLNLISVDETYTDDNDQEQRYFPVDGAMVTAPGCGRFLYGQITQIDYGSTIQTDHAGVRVPKFTLDQPNDERKLRLASRPLAMPKNYCPYIFATKVVG